ncbi:hypothetical protein FKG96_22325 [Olivibacter sp. LS-1]|uniref:DUF7683 domain-containing protein n=1 Tax=Olivibacter sp. LS-1 TaxID=2592345 RepID=UPI0011EB0232|nr:hypothetical protein [Olivibacter sp. LS-1]QEL03449.1 hypothetical protein FKG96_22325 [Olivibacter sp. LS-1]
MKIERVISWFDKHTEELKGEFVLDGVSLESLKAVFKPKADDPLMYNPYIIFEEEGRRLKEVLNFQFDFENYIYQIDCFRIS